MELDTLLSTHLVLPTVPRVEALLQAELTAPHPSLRRIDQLVATDPALALRLLQAANESSMQLTGSIHSVSEALAVLSLARVRELVEESARSASSTVLSGLPMADFWAYSLDCAKVARSVAGLVHLNQQAAFTSGLLHALGELVLRASMAGASSLDATISPFDINRARSECHFLGFCYSQVSAGLARQGHLPQVIVDALNYQHAPFDNDVYEPLAGVIHLAVWRARARHAGLHDRALIVTFPSAVADVLGLDIDMVLQQDPIDWNAQMRVWGRV